MNHWIISCTKGNEKYNTLSSSIKNTVLEDNITFHENNTKGLSEMYNFSIEHHKKCDTDSLIFIHDDVEIDKPWELFDELEKAYQQFDIVGLAGGLEPEIKPLCLWHHMCKRENWHGRVGHFDDKGNKFITDFGQTPSRVCVLDGLFLAVNLKKVRETNWKFNETDCGKFHLYDIASSLDANATGLKLGVWPILVYHHSPGLRDINDSAFQESQKKFLAKYK